MGHSWVSEAGWALVISTCVFAFFKGSAAERSGAMLVLLVDLASDVAMTINFPHVPQFALFCLDFFLAAGLLALALKYISIWLGLAMLLQSIALCAHAYVFGGDGPDPGAWMILNNVISELMLLCIIIATAVSWTKRRQATRQAASQPSPSPATAT